MEKYCKNCKIYKNFNLFHKHKKGKFGLYSICKECRKNENSSENVLIYEKKCKSCLINFKKENFYKNKNNKDGYQNDCKKCYLEKRSNNQSKIDNYMKKLLTKFCNRNKVSVLFNFNDLIKLYLLQNKKCHITGHEMTHLVDTKGRIDNIFNVSILADGKKKSFYN